MDRLEYLKALYTHLNEATRLMVKNEDFGQRLESLADAAHAVLIEIQEIDASFAPAMPSAAS